MPMPGIRPITGRGGRVRGVLLGWLVLGLFTSAHAADYTDGLKLLRAGQFAECEKLAAEVIADGSDTPDWWLLKIRAQTARGLYTEAGKSVEAACERFPSNLALRWEGHELYRKSGRAKEAAAMLAAVEKRVDARWANGPADQVALGRILLARGTDAKEVLDQFFTAVVKKSPEVLDAHYAVAELALGKHDRALAADTLQKMPKEAADDPHFHYLMARAFADDDRERSQKAFADALKINPHHADTLLFRADHLVDAEDYPAAEATLKTVLDVDPGEPRAWAYRAVIAHLKADSAGEKAGRAKALERWPADPAVDHLIGRKLSQDYRFKEGAAYQRLALEKDPKYLPAKAQLCQDLLRLGEETEGWKLAAEVFAADGYDVVAHNLVTLRDHLANFRTVASDGFILRMDAKEMDVYGPRALALLKRARKTLTDKYGVKLDKAVTVEIFPRKQDFAVRTFGMPGADGFLGVCFGPVITANSPASQGKDPSNWEAVLWHEFCHTVTLTKTKNTMPRWLSEGISVYEELQENPAWGQWLTPRYREMILGDDLTPVSKLSSAFLSPKSGLHVQFAYFESALAVEFIIKQHGFDALKAVLDDLGGGVSINAALERRAGGSLAKLDREFAEFARDRAKAAAPNATFEKPDLKDDADAAAIRAWLEKHPSSFYGRQRLAVASVKAEKWADAEKAAQDLLASYPAYVGPDNAYDLLAGVYRKTAQPDREVKALEDLAKRDGDATVAYQRLIELAESKNEWDAAAKNARRWLAVNPLTPAPHRALAKAAEKLNDRAEAMTAYRAVLLFNVPDSADVRYRLAVLLEQSGERDKARREVLKALEDAPRSRDAHALLLRLAESETKK
jgi:predicted Zn-dependent protease